MTALTRHNVDALLDLGRLEVAIRMYGGKNPPIDGQPLPKGYKPIAA